MVFSKSLFPKLCLFYYNNRSNDDFVILETLILIFLCSSTPKCDSVRPTRRWNCGNCAVETVCTRSPSIKTRSGVFASITMDHVWCPCRTIAPWSSINVPIDVPINLRQFHTRGLITRVCLCVLDTGPMNRQPWKGQFYPCCTFCASSLATHTFTRIIWSSTRTWHCVKHILDDE